MEEEQLPRLSKKSPNRTNSYKQGSNANSLRLRMSDSLQKPANALKTHIRINKSKLPADFFPKTQQGKNRSVKRLLFGEVGGKVRRSAPHRSQTQKTAMSLERTSSFVFFNDPKKTTNNTEQIELAYRNLNSRLNENLNIVTISQRPELIDKLPTSLRANDPENNSPYLKNTHISPRKGHRLKYMDYCQSIYVDKDIIGESGSPKKRRRSGQTLIELTQVNSKRLLSIQKLKETKDNIISWSTNYQSLDVTFSNNSKSTCFPPIVNVNK